jgi:biotin carboxyl carrier protein
VQILIRLQAAIGGGLRIVRAPLSQTLSALQHTDFRVATPPSLDIADQPTATAGDEATRPQDSAAPMALYAALLDAATFELGAHRLAAALAREGGFERVSIGLHQSGRSRLVAGSHVDPQQWPTDLRQAVQGAMDEALEQGMSLCWPATDKDPSRILIEHQLLQRQLGGAIATVPLGAPGAPFAALCVERRRGDSGPPFTASELMRLEQWLVLAGPALRWLHVAGQPWHRRAWRDAQQYWSALRQPERRGKRRLWMAATALVAFLALAPLEDTVGGRARIEGAQQRVLAAPTDGFVKNAHVRPGDRVKAGDPLIDLLEADLNLERERWGSQLAQHENAYAAAMARSDRVSAATSGSRVSEAQAQLALIDEQLSRGRITAPFDAVVVQGDLSQQIGAPVRQGDALLTLATSGHHRVIVEVDEVDIARVQAGQHGQLSLSSLPWDRDDIVVERIAPLAKAVDGRNVFEVEARLAAPRADLRPGLLGRADVVAGRTPPLWAWTRHALLRMRVALWTWLD